MAQVRKERLIERERKPKNPSSAIVVSHEVHTIFELDKPAFRSTGTEYKLHQRQGILPVCSLMYPKCQELYLAHRRQAKISCWLNKCNFGSIILLLSGFEHITNALQGPVKTVNNSQHHWRNFKWDKAAIVKMAQRDFGSFSFSVLNIGRWDKISLKGEIWKPVK